MTDKIDAAPISDKAEPEMPRGWASQADKFSFFADEPVQQGDKPEQPPLTMSQFASKADLLAELKRPVSPEVAEALNEICETAKSVSQPNEAERLEELFDIARQANKYGSYARHVSDEFLARDRSEPRLDAAQPEPIRAVLQELVDLKDMKGRIDQAHAADNFAKDEAEYRRRKPLAWAAARAILAAPIPAQADAGLARDALRYRWLREHRTIDPNVYPSAPWPVRCILDPIPTPTFCGGTDLDAAVDTAMTKEGK